MDFSVVRPNYPLSLGQVSRGDVQSHVFVLSGCCQVVVTEQPPADDRGRF